MTRGSIIGLFWRNYRKVFLVKKHWLILLGLGLVCGACQKPAEPEALATPPPATNSTPAGGGGGGIAPIGPNIGGMKCGGITEALRIVATAKAFGLKTMIGCMSESSVAIAAGATIGNLFDSIDLDSHLNLNPDPATGATIVDGVITPNDNPGHGASLNA